MQDPDEKIPKPIKKGKQNFEGPYCPCEKLQFHNLQGLLHWLTRTGIKSR